MTSPSVLATPTHGVKLWTTVVGGIGWWMLHIFAESALAKLSCGRVWAMWLINGITAGLAAATLLGVIWSIALIRDHPDARDQGGDVSSRRHFLGVFGLVVGGFSLLLIVWEGVYVAVLNPCGA